MAFKKKTNFFDGKSSSVADAHPEDVVKLPMHKKSGKARKAIKPKGGSSISAMAPVAPSAPGAY